MTLYFITGNKHKFSEVKAILGDVEQLDIDLPEIQELDPENIVEAKLLEALKHKKGEFIVEDTSLHMECLKGLPGPLIKWFIQAMGIEGIAEMAARMGDNTAKARTIIGYAKNKDKIHYFEGTVQGQIVFPKAESPFEWDPIFQPEGYDVSFAEMSRENKNKISMRRKALNGLKEFLKLQAPHKTI